MSAWHLNIIEKNKDNSRAGPEVQNCVTGASDGRLPIVTGGKTRGGGEGGGGGKGGVQRVGRPSN